MGAGGLGCLRSNLACDFQRGLIAKKSSLKFCICFQRVLVGAGGFAYLRSNLECDFQRELIAKKVVRHFVYVFKGFSWGRVV